MYYNTCRQLTKLLCSYVIHVEQVPDAVETKVEKTLMISTRNNSYIVLGSVLGYVLGYINLIPSGNMILGGYPIPNT
jgi:hypothetical protein